MPRKIEWIQQVPSALVELKGLASPVVDRAILGKVLGVHRRVAIRLMGTFGGFQVGKTFLIGRELLIGRLEEIGRGEHYEREFDRRVQLSAELEKTRRLAPRRQVRITAAADVRDRVLADLPAGIHLHPGELRIEFVTAEELLAKLFELSQAMVNDWGRFQEAGNTPSAS